MANGGSGGSGPRAGPTLADRVGALEDAIGAVDPGYVDAFESDCETVTPAAMTSGPQRLTFLIPCEETVLNLGQEVAPRGPTSFGGIDTGIGGHTLQHIDFQALNAPETTVTLGCPVQTAPTFVRDAVPTGCTGYALATADIAYHEADMQHYVVSRDGDVICRAASSKPAVLNTKGGCVGCTEVNAGGDVAITAGSDVWISAGGWGAPGPARAADWQTTGFSSTSSGLAQMAGALAALVTSIAGILQGMLPLVEKANAMTTGAGPTKLPSDKAAVAAATVGALLNMARHGIVIHGRGDANVGAGKYAGLWGNVCSGILGGLVSGLYGATADVKGFLFAGVWGQSESSLAALGNTSVVATSGSVESFSGGQTHITSIKSLDFEAPEAQLSAANAAAVSADGGTVYALGEKYGLEITGTSAKMGHFSSTDQCGGASFEDSKAHIEVTNSWVKAQSSDGDYLIRLDTNGAWFETKHGFIRMDSNSNISFFSDGKFVTCKG